MIHEMTAFINSNLLLFLFCAVIGFSIIILILLSIIGKRRLRIQDLQGSLHQLSNSFNELDEQAKLIVKTDLELNKAQEELNKRINALDALQKISHLISTTLDEKEIFARLNQPILSELGFERFLIAVTDAQNFVVQLHLGFSKEEGRAAINALHQYLKGRRPLRINELLSSLREFDESKEAFTKIFNVKHYIFAPLHTQNELLGFIFVGNTPQGSAITEGDEEIVSILSDQIGQVVENARLFEQVYRARHSLELKVQERTKQLSSALEEVNKISKTKTDFISAVSHELRTPLTSIKGYASLLISGKIGEIPEKVKDRLTKINKHSDNLVKLINELLDISRIESGKVEMRFTKEPISAVIESVHDLLTPQLKDKGIRFEIAASETIPDVPMDRSQIERVLINLIGNAIKFTPEQGLISIQITADHEKITTAISDSGIGISEEDLDKIFNEFYRVDNPINQTVKGTGLGLPLTKKIIEAHHGTIWVTSKINEGASFYFTLPVKQNLPAFQFP